MLKNKFSISRSLLIVFVSAIIFAVMKQLGVYGFGNDYHAAYNEQNLNFGSLFNRLGWIISTFSIFGNHYGVFFTTLILGISYGIFLRSIFIFQKLTNIYFFLFILIVGFHTWPIIMSTSNAMRQGLCMSMIFLYLTFYLEKKLFLSFFFIFLSIFMHKSGPFIALIFLFSLIIKYFLERIKNYHNLYYVFFSVIIFLFCWVLVFYFEDGTRNSRIIHKDYRYHFVSLSFIYFTIFHYKNNLLKKNFINIFLYFYIFATLAVFFEKLNYEYERLQMILLIPMIFAFGFIFNKRSLYIYYGIVFPFLLLLTVINGMYKSFY